MDFSKAKQEFIQSLNEALQQRKKPRIMVCGYIGVGKTSLIQAILGKEVVPEDRVSHGKPGTMSFIDYNNEFINLIDTRGFEPSMDEDYCVRVTKNEVIKRQSSNNIDDHIHLVWYCIDGPGARVTSTDLRLIKEIFSRKNMLIVITKGDIIREQQLRAIIEELTSIGVAREKIILVSDLKEHPGRKELVDKSISIIPQAYKDAFISKQKISLERKKEKAREIIEQYVVLTTGVGLIPFLDIPVIIPLQMRMIAKLSENYGFETEQTTGMITSASIATIIGSLTATTAMDWLGLFGVVLGAISAGAITGGLGTLVNGYFITCSEAIINDEDIGYLGAFEFTREQLIEAGKSFR